MDTRSLSYQFGEFTLDIERGCLLKSGEEIRLRPKVYETLRYLVENAGRLIGKKELLEVVWPDSFVTDDSLRACVAELRRALEDRDQQLLRTVPRRGYVFAAEVLERIANQESGAPAPPHFAGSGAIFPPRYISLVGREQEVAEAAALLLRPDVRLLTITGPGGAGKTRLAIAVASATAERFTAGVQLVGLASITDPDLCRTTLARRARNPAGRKPRHPATHRRATAELGTISCSSSITSNRCSPAATVIAGISRSLSISENSGDQPVPAFASMASRSFP